MSQVVQIVDHLVNFQTIIMIAISGLSSPASSESELFIGITMVIFKTT